MGSLWASGQHFWVASILFFCKFKCRSSRKKLKILPPDLLADLRKSLQFLKLQFLHWTFKVLIYHFPCFEVNVLGTTERVACYAHTWHLTAAALRLSLLITEPALTLSAHWRKLYTFRDSGQHTCIVPRLFLFLCGYIHHIWEVFIF